MLFNIVCSFKFILRKFSLCELNKKDLLTINIERRPNTSIRSYRSDLFVCKRFGTFLL
ncbi:hypothetical protein S122051_1843 [Staphylococcus aureus subsp. aureus 122051]|nr:hypothetical protein Newbould305_0081 [Staphylococcus aureus subsp. aureus str. Newbould 305]EOR32520.1 hypothetical protein S091751_2338 [Staphylococcus aureus subsp. aureus 091751]EOR36291.1 hypothetical protein S103564_0697 [Staphylococcus aureus subsp. aureus 103564]EOR38592.1 hypothetical protein MRGR3_2198 [Staphylococcus aureus subsp. aureus MRGR3]EOR41218.1 hypothetical protein S122051_1843 [Staphylococcus aureus subsp. aureus 122051]EOR47896.1 hypothetical protein M140OLGA_1862 [St